MAWMPDSSRGCRATVEKGHTPCPEANSDIRTRHSGCARLVSQRQSRTCGLRVQRRHRFAKLTRSRRCFRQPVNRRSAPCRLASADGAAICRRIDRPSRLPMRCERALTATLRPALAAGSMRGSTIRSSAHFAMRLVARPGGVTPSCWSGCFGS